MSILSKADEANKINDTVRNEISQNLFIFCNYEPIPHKLTNDPGGFLLLKINNLYKLLVDSGWVIKKFAYIYSGQDNPSNPPFDSCSINDIYATLKNLRTGFCHNVSHNNGDDIIISQIKLWFSKNRSSSSGSDYTDCVKQIDDYAKKIIDVCNQFINCVKALPDADKESIVERWKGVIIEHYKNKQDFLIRLIGNYYLVKNTQQYSKKIYNIAKEIILSYFTYDFEQYLDRINNLPFKDNRKLSPILKSIDDAKKKRAYDLFKTEDFNLFYPKNYNDEKKLIDLFFEKELGNVINDTLKIVPDCSLLPQHILNEILDKTETIFDGFRTPCKRFDFSPR